MVSSTHTRVLLHGQDWVGPAVVDGVLEEIRIGLEINHPKFNQRRVASVKYLGELYNYRVIESTIIFKVLLKLQVLLLSSDFLLGVFLYRTTRLLKIYFCISTFISVSRTPESRLSSFISECTSTGLKISLNFYLHLFVHRTVLFGRCCTLLSPLGSYLIHRWSQSMIHQNISSAFSWYAPCSKLVVSFSAQGPAKDVLIAS